MEWLNIPEKIKPSKDLFACQVIGESMNKVIPNGALCLFRKYSGGSRNGQIVLVENTNMHDFDFGSCYTVKEYESKKYEDEEQDADRAGRPSEVYHHRYFWIRSNSFSTLTTSMSDSNIGD